jgi:protein-tyrosine phosphatase
MHSESASAPRLASVPNFRDLGGLPAADGRHIAYGKLFRSEAILSLAQEDEAILLAQSIRLVCDLRSRSERAAAPNTWWKSSGAELMELDITADIRGTAHWEAMRNDPGEAGAIALMRLTYRALPWAATTHLQRVFGRIAEGHLPLILHCTAGKDRTGVVAALLLSALGVPRTVIYEDYLESGRQQNPAIVAQTRDIMRAGLGHDVEPAALHALCGVRAEYLDEAFASMEETYGSAGGFLAAAAGLDVALRETLHAQILV